MGQLLFVANGGGGGGGGCTQRFVIWRPGGVVACDVATTWAEVEAYIATTQGALTIAVDPSLAPATIPATADTECFGSVKFTAYAPSITSFPNMDIADGGRLRNPWTFQGVGLSCTSSASGVIPIRLDIPGGILIAREGGRVSLDAGATLPAVQISAEFCELATFEGGSFQNNAGNPLLAVADIDPAITQVLFASISAAGSFLPASPLYGPTMFSGGGAGTTIIRIWDSSAPPVAQTNFLGGYFDLPMSNAVGTIYDDTVVPVPSLGVGNVQAAIDVLKVQVAALVPGSYRTSFINADLVVGVLTVIHGLGVNFNTYAIYDNLNFSVLNPDSVLNVDGNTIAIDLSTYQLANGGAIPGTWNVVVQS
jgi:hypothetical protein